MSKYDVPLHGKLSRWAAHETMLEFNRRFQYKWWQLGRRWRLKKELKKYPQGRHSDLTDSFLYTMGWHPDNLKTKRRWWQFWKRRRRVTAVGSGKRARGKPLICTRPDLTIIDDFEKREEGV